MTESCRNVWRRGIAPLLSVRALEALRRALEEDDPQLFQGLTCFPPPVECLMSLPVEQADALAYCGWKSMGLGTVGEVEEYVVTLCEQVDQRMGEPGAFRWFIEWFDAAPRDEMRQQLLAEVLRALAERATRGGEAA